MATKRKIDPAQQEIDEIEQAYRSISESKKTRKNFGPYSRAVAISAICAFVVVILVGIFLGYQYLADRNRSSTILPNITVAGVDVGGMTVADAINAVTLATERTYSENTMVVTVLGTRMEITPTDSRITLNVEAAVEEAHRFGRTGSWSRRQEERNIAQIQGYAVDLTPHILCDEEAIRNILQTAGNQFSTTLKKTTWTLTGSAPSLTFPATGSNNGHLLTIHMGHPEYSLDMQLLYKQVMAAYSSNTFRVEGTCPMVDPGRPDLEAIYNQYYIAPINATLDTTTYEVISGTYGYGFDLIEAQKRLDKAAYGETIQIQFSRITPDVTNEMLQGTLFRDVLAEYTTKNTSQGGRDVNLSLACKAINGMILYPGQLFSYNEALGERTPEKGYRPAASYWGNQVIYSYGGGICQVSSTLYYCTLIADLQIEERVEHGFYPGYIGHGLDATVDWGLIDFTFRNNTNYPIRIEASSSYGNVTVRLIGTDEKDYYVKMESEILQTIPFKVVYKDYAYDNSQGYKDGDVITSPYTGYVVKTYKCKYDKKTDALISRTFEADSEYNKRDKVVARVEPAPVPPVEPPTEPPTDLPTEPPTDLPTEPPTDLPTEPPPNNDTTEPPVNPDPEA